MYFIASEGYATEVRYFKALKDNRDIAGISSLVEIVVLQRDSCDSGVSDPLRIVSPMDDYVASLKACRFRLDTEIGINIGVLLKETKGGSRSPVS